MLDMNQAGPPATLMLQEARQAADCISTQISENSAAFHAVGERLRTLKPRALITCGRGSSDHAATYLRYLVELHLGLITSSVSPSVRSVYGVSQDMSGYVFVAISQSGRSPDLLAATRSAKAAGAYVVALVNVVDSPLAELADDCLPLHAGAERSVAATKSYLCTLAASLQLVAYWSESSVLAENMLCLPGSLRLAWGQDWSVLTQALVEAEHLLVLGRGIGLSAAQEVALKFKETCGLHAEAFSSAEFCHGPKALLQRPLPVLMLCQSDATERWSLHLARELNEYAAPLVLAGASLPGVVSLPCLPFAPAVMPFVLVLGLYKVAAQVAIARGLDPDCPPLLRKVTETN